MYDQMYWAKLESTLPHVQRDCKSSGPPLLKRRGRNEFSAGIMRILGRCNVLATNTMQIEQGVEKSIGWPGMFAYYPPYNLGISREFPSKE